MKREKDLLSRLSYWQSFRFIFILFSLYLMNDVFYRWDGFKMYASFAEFLPSISLAFILWSIIAVLITLVVWFTLITLEQFAQKIWLKIKREHILFFSGVFVVLGALAWKGKKVIWSDVETSIQIKQVVFICVLLAAVALTFIARKRTKQWLDIVQYRITPLVWIFSIFLILSVPMVVYHAWYKVPEKVVSKNTKHPQAFSPNRPNIILVTFDALAAREMSLYGYHRETTPYIDNWAKKATLFTRAEAASNFTASTTASLMTGKRVWTHQTYHIEGSKPIRSNEESLPALLKKNGYFNIALVVNPFASVRILGMEKSFDVSPRAYEFSVPASFFGWKFGIVDTMLYRAFGERIRLHNWIIKNDFIFGKFLNVISRNLSQTTVPPERAFSKFMEIIDDNIPMPFFAWIHIFPPHDPYLPPIPYRGKFNSTSELREYKDQEKLIQESYKYLFEYKPLPSDIESAVSLMRDNYDEFLMYIDKKYKEFIEELNFRKIENTVLILSADHGESFEHGYFTHGGPFLFEQVTHIPLIIKEPGQVKGQIIDTLVEQIDIPATVLDFAGISVPSWMEGRSLVPLMYNKKLPDRPAFSMNYEENRSLGHQIEKGSIAIWEADYKLIHYLEREGSLLFNLKRDPDELNNLIDTEPEISRHMMTIIKKNLNEANKKNKYEK
jgi:arylsulfatase A-like enzyme